ncbi:MAG TPA: (d)CMP kinase, partial [Sphingomonas sp.]|nr:(d)CMP kinase [Sphingomonas sp.]
LRTDEVGKAASVVSAHPLVRAALLNRQKKFARQPGGAVLDGRDIGTVIAPDADAKLFVKATPQIRARRRHAELKERGSTLSFDKVLADIRVRDQRDMGRDAAPLVMAADAGILDTSFLSIEAAVKRAIELVERQVQLKAAAKR